MSAHYNASQAVVARSVEKALLRREIIDGKQALLQTWELIDTMDSPKCEYDGQYIAELKERIYRNQKYLEHMKVR